MANEIKTRIDEEVLKGKASVSVLSLSEEKYVYKLMKDGTPYILKGYRIEMPPLDDPGASESYVEALRQIGLVYQEFYLAKIDSVFNPHYVKPLQIASIFMSPASPGEEATVYVEILFEHGGDSLEAQRKRGAVPIKQVYNWMRQSANALAFLHRTGISHLDIKPSNMVYEEANDLLKVIDMGSSTAYTSQSQMFSSTRSVTSKIRELTIYYAPPEILQAYNNKALLASPVTDPLEFIVGNIDVYCWAMCFYTILLRKKDKELENEITRFKLHKAEDYAPFLAAVEACMEKVPAKDEEETKLRGLIRGILIKALQYNAKDRPKLEAIVQEMRAFDEREGVTLGYLKLEKAEQEKMNNILGLSDFIARQEERIKALTDQAEKKREEYESFDKSMQEVKTRLAEMDSSKLSLQQTLAEKQKELDKCAAAVQSAQEVTRLVEENKDLKAKYEAVSAELESIKSRHIASPEPKPKPEPVSEPMYSLSATAPLLQPLQPTVVEQKPEGKLGPEEELREKAERIARLEGELAKTRNMYNSLMKKCDAYTQLQLKYSNDTMALAKERDRLSKRLHDLSAKVWFSACDYRGCDRRRPKGSRARRMELLTLLI